MIIRKFALGRAGAAAGIACLFAIANAGSAVAQDAPGETRHAISLTAALTSDAVATVSGGQDHRLRYLDNLDLVADADMDAIAGLTGTTAHLYVLNNAGAIPNDGAGTIQGTDNIEVPRNRLRLYEAWIETPLGHNANVRLGLYDLNSEFYSNDAAGLLIAPPFGIGSELALTGPNGPSIFPETALAIRVSARVGADGFVRAAVINARAGILADGESSPWAFRQGVLAIGEAGLEGARKFALGLWRYSNRQDHVREVDVAGASLRHASQGIYIVAEQPLTAPDAERQFVAFARGGVSDGATSPFKGSWQAGLLATGVVRGRPESQFSFGMAQGVLSRGFKRNQRDAGLNPASETILEATYADRVLPFLTVQPDLQYILNPGGDSAARNALFVGVRFMVDFSAGL